MKVVENFCERRKRETHALREVLVIFGKEEDIEEYLKNNPQKEEVIIHKVFSMKHRAHFINKAKAIVLPGCPDNIKMKVISHQDVTFL